MYQVLLNMGPRNPRGPLDSLLENAPAPGREILHDAIPRLFGVHDGESVVCVWYGVAGGLLVAVFLDRTRQNLEGCPAYTITRLHSKVIGGI